MCRRKQTAKQPQNALQVIMGIVCLIEWKNEQKTGKMGVI